MPENLAGDLHLFQIEEESDLSYFHADLSIPYYADLHFISAGEIFDCTARIDKKFGPTIALNLIWQGGVHFAMDDARREELAGPMAFWTWDGPRFRYSKMTGTRWHQLWVHAGGARAALMVEKGLVPVKATPWGVPPNPEAFIESFRRLVDLVQEGRTDDQAERVQIFEQLFREAGHDTKNGSSQNKSQRQQIESLATRIKSEPFRNYDFEKESKRMGYSYPHMRRLFKALIGRPPQAYLLDCRIRWAAGQLTAGSESVKSVGFSAGFAATSSFARQFRRRTGVPPGTLRTTEKHTNHKRESQ